MIRVVCSEPYALSGKELIEIASLARRESRLDCRIG
jgi:hypothetical protein